MWLDMRDAFCCRFSVFRDFAKIKKPFQLAPVSPMLFVLLRLCFSGVIFNYRKLQCRNRVG